MIRLPGIGIERPVTPRRSLQPSQIKRLARSLAADYDSRLPVVLGHPKAVRELLAANAYEVLERIVAALLRSSIGNPKRE